MMTPEAFLSDADGTLVDTLHLIRHGQYETSKAYLMQVGVAPSAIPSYETYEVLLNQVVGGSARDTLERTVRLLYQDQPHHLDGLDFDALHDMLNPVQDKLAPEFVKPYEGLSRFLNRIGETGIKLAIFTSGTPHHVVRNFGVALPELGLTELYKDTGTGDVQKLRLFESQVKQHFAITEFTVVTCDDVSTHKPDPASLIMAMDRLNVQPDRSAVLGDHIVDIKAGVNAHVLERIGITHGFNGDRLLLDAGATRVVHSLDELTNQLSPFQPGL